MIKLENKLVTTKLLNRTVITNQLFETSMGNPIGIDHDILGIKRNENNTVAGRFETIVTGVNRIQIWP